MLEYDKDESREQTHLDKSSNLLASTMGGCVPGQGGALRFVQWLAAHPFQQFYHGGESAPRARTHTTNLTKWHMIIKKIISLDKIDFSDISELHACNSLFGSKWLKQYSNASSFANCSCDMHSLVRYLQSPKNFGSVSTESQLYLKEQLELRLRKEGGFQVWA